MVLAHRSSTCTALLCIYLSISVIAQSTPAEARLQGYQQRLDLEEQSLISTVPFENVGPTVFSGRVVDIDVNPADPTIYYVAYASGGLWKTVNNGTTFTPLFDHEMVMTIGDIAVDWTSGTIWLGSGESNSSRSSYAGNGIYKSTDHGSSWQYLGLPESHHIGRILLDPDDQNVVHVAACGHLYTSNPDRGIYRTSDGGANWQQVLYVDEGTGGIDLIRDPLNRSVLYAAMWQRERKAWDFQEAGRGSGIYRSQDGGETWRLMTTEESGFPHGDGVGRIGLAASMYGGKTYLYALLDNYFRRPADEEEDEELSKNELRDMTAEHFDKLDDEQIKGYLMRYRFPKKYGVAKVRKMVAEGEISPLALVEYVEDANSLLFDTPVIGGEVYRSENGGLTWSRTHEDYLDRLYNSYGYYFGRIGVHPTNPDKVYVLGVPFLRSNDGGKTWLRSGGSNVHSDHQALWINPSRPGHLIDGNDGGINTSYDDGETWTKQNSPAVGQFYAIAFDKAKPYHLYGGTQDNGVWKGPSNYQPSDRWHSTGHYPYETVLGGDGMQVQVDWRDNETIYTGFSIWQLLSDQQKERCTQTHQPQACIRRTTPYDLIGKLQSTSVVTIKTSFT